MSNKRRYSALVLTFVLALLGVFAGSSLSQGVPVALMPMPRMQFFSATGTPLAGGCVNFFAAGTSTPQAIYADQTGTVQLPNPLTLDAAGEATVWLANLSYKVVVNTGVPNTACSVSLGTQLWAQDNVSSYQIINQAQNLFLAVSTSDPSGTAGELGYRSDLGCFRGFTTLWDCFVTQTATQTLTNKTLTSPVINTPAVNGGTFSVPVINTAAIVNSPGTYEAYPNTAPGNVLGNLMKVTNVAGTASITSTAAADTGGVIGVLVAGAGSTGTIGTVQGSGTSNCNFDGAATAGDYVQISASFSGLCHDVGAVYPTSGQVIGKVRISNAGAGLTQLDMFGPEIQTSSQGAKVVFSTASATTNGSVASTPMVTASGSGNKYVFNAQATLAVAGTSCTGNSTIQLNISYTDAVTGSASTTGGVIGVATASSGAVSPTPIIASSGNGTVGNVIWYLPTTINAKASTTVSYSTNYTGGGACSPAPQYYITPVLTQVQ